MDLEYHRVLLEISHTGKVQVDSVIYVAPWTEGEKLPWILFFHLNNHVLPTDSYEINYWQNPLPADIVNLDLKHEVSICSSKKYLISKNAPIVNSALSPWY